MPVPATRGVLRTTIKDMKIGDYISCYWFWGDNNLTGGMKNMSLNQSGPELSIENPTASGNFYFIKADKGLLIADRVTQVSIAWTTINQNKCIEGLQKIFRNGWDGVSDISGVIRSLTGGVAYADEYGNKIIPNINEPKPPYGAFPTNNEYDTYIRLSNLNGKITPNDIHVWNHGGLFFWCQDTPNNGINSQHTGVLSNYRITRGRISVSSSFYSELNYNEAARSFEAVGFRPVFEYKE
ncbi:hypothetical protein [Paenibacillus sp. OSY-SE]|uniref:hypothetical protein n=1 Tax=Paenibacillus sp. OSY-SE TaxID=1196323 RepID=UPI0003075D34|nr:hypothetical protein [Paenibacillus sp. OSY-SE]